MEFNDLIKGNILPILNRYGFEIVEERKNFILFRSSIMKVKMVFNECDKTFLIEIGKIGDMLYPLNDEVINHVFNLKLSIKDVDINLLVKNVVLLFQSKKGIDLLEGNVKLLKDAIYEQSEIYTSEIIRNQILNIALKAWEVKDYIKYIGNIDKIGVDKVPKSYQLKYQKAKQKIN